MILSNDKDTVSSTGLKFRCGTYYFFFFSIQAILTPSLQLFLQAQGYDYLQIGVLQGIFQVVGVFGPVLVGKIADMTGNYRIFIALALAGVLPCFILIDVTPVFWLNCIFAAIAGFLARSTLPLSDALVSHSLADPGKEYGMVRPFGSLGFLLTATLVDLTGVFKNRFSERFLIILIAASAASIVVLFLLPRFRDTSSENKTDSSLNKEGQSSSTAIPPVFFVILIAVFFGSLGSAGFMSFYTLFLVSDQVGAHYPNIHWALGAVCEIPFIFFSALFVKRWGIPKMLGVSLIAIIIRLGLYGMITNPFLLLSTQILNGLTFGLFHSVAIASINKYVPASKKGLGMALYSSLTKGSALFIGNIVGGIIAERYGLTALFRVFTLFSFPGLVVLLFVTPLEKRAIGFRNRERQKT